MTDMNFQQLNAIEKLVAIMSMLRDKQFGCPWDLEQSIESLVPFTLEEVYEVVDAIEKQDMFELEDELGDLLFQVVFYAQIAKEAGLFNFDDIANTISNKLVRRHPHVFPDGAVANFGSKLEISSDQVAINWEVIKQEEKKLRKGNSDTENNKVSALTDIPLAMPSLDRAHKLQESAARAGFDWHDLSPVLAKLREEIAELEAAIKTGVDKDIQAELGDVLFTTVNVGRHIRVDSEAALRSANVRFEKRVKWVESQLHDQGKTINQAQPTELDQLWERAKLTGL